MPTTSPRGKYSRSVAAQHAVGGRRRTRRRRIWPALTFISAIALVVLGLGAWVGSRALVVKDELSASQTMLKDTGSLTKNIDAIGAHAAKAALTADDPLWRATESVPMIGDNLRAVRLSAESLDTIVNQLAKPVLALKGDGSAEPLLQRALPVIDAASPRVEALAADIHRAAKSSSLVGQVRRGVEQVDGVMSAASPVLKVLPDLLGARGARNYLLVFQNNAESLPLGGSAASQTLINVDNGKITIAKQASSASYRSQAVDVKVDQSALDLYSRYLVDHVNTTMSRPDFPTAAKLITAFWQRDVDPAPVDGVVSVDPIALGRVLVATGPVSAPDGAQLTSENAVSELLSKVYARWDSYKYPSKVDEFFAGVAQSVFAKIASGQFDPKAMVWAVNAGINNGDIMMWSDDPTVSSFIKGQRITGILPTDNKSATTVGVFFRDTSASKIDFYMKSTIDARETCTGDSHTFTATAGLHLDIAQKAANALPRYVQSYTWGAKKFRTEVFVYGPPGTTFKAAKVNGADVRPTNTSVNDLGRPVAAFEVFLKPGAQASVTAEFAGVGRFGPVEVRSTPMVNPTKTTVSTVCN